MIEGKPSVMAEWAALVRALHPVLDERPLVFEDPIAGRLLGADFRRLLAGEHGVFRSEGMLLIRSMMMMRTRFAEERLAAGLQSGVRQYVILGAGLDSFAYRQPPAAAGVTIYEVDHPDTQAWKRERLAAAQITPPANLRFVPLDFTHQQLGPALAAAGFDRDAAASFTWMGVTYYLPLPSFLDTLRFIVGQGKRGSVAFDFAIRDARLPAHLAGMNDEIFEFMKAAGEPWQLYFAPAELETQLRALGYPTVEYLSPAAADVLYLRERRDGLRAGPLVGLMYAAR